MAQTPERVEAFLATLVPAALAKVHAEHDEIRALFEDDAAGGGRVEGWDWQFYAEQVRQAKYDLAATDLTPYLELNRVLRDGVFYAAERLYGITVRQRTDLPVYHPDVEVFEVLDADGGHLGVFYTDLFRRDNKNGGAWMDNLLTQSSLLGTHPIVCNVLNVDTPAPGEPALLSLDEVITLFHEFGHALHGLCANQRYPSLSGTAVARDFVELPSLFNEHWALDPAVIGQYARHHQTGEPIPPALVAKIRQASTFNQGYSLTEILAATILDLRWHTLAASVPQPDIDRFERQALGDARLDIPAVPPRYDSRYFLHIWANGYDAGYYAYLWAEMLAHDVAAWFDEHGGLTRENGRRFRDCILSRGNTREYEQMFLDFRQRGPEIGPMLRFRGLTAHPDSQPVGTA
jgi:peptidyl-dipeptidase Dcp